MIVGIDFGTTNTVICLIGDDGIPRSVRFTFDGTEYDVFRSVLTFWQETEGRTRVLQSAAGPEAIQTYLDDALSCRLIMSMKTYLSQRTFTQTRIFNQDFRLEDLVARFLQTAFASGGLDAAQLGDAVRVVAGRPVRFAGERADDTLGEQRLRQSFARAGLAQVDVALEPEGAGYRFIRKLTRPATVLVGDFGGGTSDFTLLRFEPGGAAGRGSIAHLGHGGIGIAGDTFDRRIMEQVVCPLLGRGDSYKVMGKDMPVPIGLYAGLAQWHRLSLMRTPRMLNEIADIARTARHPERLLGLARLIQDEAGYDLYRAVSASKAALSSAEQTVLRFDHPGLRIEQQIRRADFETWIAADLALMGDVVDKLLAAAGLGVHEVDDVFLTGGSSLVPAVRQLFATRFGADRLRGGGEFIAVAEGLALIGQDRAAQVAA